MKNERRKKTLKMQKLHFFLFSLRSSFRRRSSFKEEEGAERWGTLWTTSSS